VEQSPLLDPWHDGPDPWSERSRFTKESSQHGQSEMAETNSILEDHLELQTMIAEMAEEWKEQHETAELMQHHEAPEEKLVFAHASATPAQMLKADADSTRRTPPEPLHGPSQNGITEAQLPRKVEAASVSSSHSVLSSRNTGVSASHFSSAIFDAKAALENMESLASSLQKLEQTVAEKQAELALLEAREQEVEARERAVESRQAELDELQSQLLGASEEIMAGLTSGLQSGIGKLSRCRSSLGSMGSCS